MTVKLGWKVNLAVAVFGDRAPQEITLTVRRGKREDQFMGPWRVGMTDLANAVNHGAMCGAKIEPTASSMELLDIAWNPNGDLQTKFKIAAVDPGAWRTITSLAVFFTYGSASPSVRIAAKSSGAKKHAITEANVWNLPYPSLSQHLPFKLNRDEEDPTSDEILLRVRFRKKLDAETKKDMLGAMKSLSTLLFGGYPHDDEDMTTCGTSSNEAYLVDPRTVEYSARYTGHPAGLDAAVLIAQWFHEKGAAIESVMIE